MLSSDMEDIKKIEIGLLKIKTTMSEVKTTLYRINGKLDIVEIEDKIIDTIQNLKKKKTI